MFSHEPRRRFLHAPVMEVICQFRFPEILSIGAHVPVDFQEAIRKEFPQYRANKEFPAPQISGTPGNYSIQNQQEITNYQFVDAAGHLKINLTSRFLSLSCSDYTVWENFAQKLDLPLAAFIKTYEPAYFERVGLRYINAFSRTATGTEDLPFRELIQPCYLGVLAEEDVQERSASRSTMDLEMALNSTTHVKIHAGPGMVKRAGRQDQEVRFILDDDLFTGGKIPISHSANVLQSLHQQADSIFLGSITSRMAEAMEPQEYL